MPAAADPDSALTPGILFTDLDGTLLDRDRYRPSDAAVSALRHLATAGVKVVAVTSKTAAEVRALLRELPLDPPAVVEGGAAILRPDGTEQVVGLPREQLVEVLPALRAAGAAVRGFSEMTSTELAGWSGLDAASAALANTRSASEPFVLLTEGDGDLDRRLAKAARERGADVTRGGRFWHLTGAGIHKASGVRLILEEWPGRIGPTAAVGDAWNDLPMLDLVDHGFLLGNAVPTAEIPVGVIQLTEVGPAGFVEAVARLVRFWELPDLE